MLKTKRQQQTWLITQPDHARVSGYLAAHWGNDVFARPGYYADSPDPERLRAETVFAITQHDNGWWETDANPEISKSDGFPVALPERQSDATAGMDRWRRGVRRFESEHRYAGLLISYHAYWLYAAKILEDPDPAFAHPLFWKGLPDALVDGTTADDRAFADEMKQLQEEWIAALREDPQRAHWVEPAHLNPHARLLQLCDGVSLSLCSALIQSSSDKTHGLGSDAFELHEVPRRHWADRVTIAFNPVRERRIGCKPYPFDRDPLRVSVPVRIFEHPAGEAAHFSSWWNAQAQELVRFEYYSA